LLKVTALQPVLGFLGARAVPIGASVVVHAAVIFTAVGHPAGAAADARADAVEVEVSTLTPVPDEAEREKPPLDAPHEEPHAAAHHHTHPYPVPESHDWTPHDPSLVHTFAPAALPLPASPTAPTPPARIETETETAPPPAAATAALPQFDMTVGAGAPGTHGAVTSTAPTAPHAGGGVAGAGMPGADDGADAPVPESAVTTPARLASGGAPPYPPEARAFGIEANVPLELVVSPAGVVESARGMGGTGGMAARAGHGLDEAALAAVRGYRFVPATRGGRPVRVRMRWVMSFELR